MGSYSPDDEIKWGGAGASLGVESGVDGSEEGGLSSAAGAPDPDDGVAGLEADEDGVEVGLDSDWTGVAEDVFNGGRERGGRGRWEHGGGRRKGKGGRLKAGSSGDDLLPHGYGEDRRVSEVAEVW